MWEPDYDKQINYWSTKDMVSQKADPSKLKARIM